MSIEIDTVLVNIIMVFKRVINIVGNQLIIASPMVLIYNTVLALHHLLFISIINLDIFILTSLDLLFHFIKELFIELYIS